MTGLIDSARTRLRRVLSAPKGLREDPIFVLGHQKSGTTAVAQLLTRSLAESYSHDMFYRRKWADKHLLISGQLTVRELIARGPAEFKCGVIKDPHLSFAFRDLRHCFPAAQFVMVLRHPASVLRSIFNRLEMDGRTQQSQAARLPKPWAETLKGFPPYITGSSPIEVLSARWKHIAQIYLENGSIIKPLFYEKFMEDRQAVIETMVRELGRVPKRPIADAIDIQFQRAGNRNVELPEFFGEENLKRIEDLCSPVMQHLGYGRAEG